MLPTIEQWVPTLGPLAKRMAGSILGWFGAFTLATFRRVSGVLLMIGGVAYLVLGGAVAWGLSRWWGWGSRPTLKQEMLRFCGQFWYVALLSALLITVGLFLVWPRIFKKNA